jgi:dethiobiotin synthetase
MKLGIFVTGTDTGVGKTFLSSLLISSLRAYGIKTGYFKPIQTGMDWDTQMVSTLTGVPAHKFPAPVYSFPEPIAPYRAASLNQVEIQMDQILQAWERCDERAWVVEGAGGLLVPLNGKMTNRDLVQILKLRLIIVARTQLGTINHTLLTIEAAKAVGIPIVGLVLIGPEDIGLGTVLSECSGVPVLAEIPWYTEVTEMLVQEKGVALLPAAKLRMIYD